jgi:hypothetical protein
MASKICFRSAHSLAVQLTLPLMAATSAMLSSASPCFLLPFFLLGFGGASGSAVVHWNTKRPLQC